MISFEKPTPERVAMTFSTSEAIGLSLGAAAAALALQAYLSRRREPVNLSPCAPPPPATRGLRFKGKRALITGGARGIGRAIAIALSREGADVFVCDVLGCEEARRLEGVAEGDTVDSTWTWIKCDAGSPRQIEEACKSVGGGIDILFNNVAVQPEAPCHEHTLADWSRAISVNLTSYFLFCHHLLPGMLAKGAGSIVNLASVRSCRMQSTSTPHSALRPFATRLSLSPDRSRPLNIPGNVCSGPGTR